MAEMDKIASASFESKPKLNLPSDAEIIKKDYSIRVREIENGFIIEKSYDIKYRLGDETNYEYVTKMWFSEDNPMEISLEESDGEDLADKLD